MSSKGAEVRLKKELKRLKDDPVYGIMAEPKPTDILEWHFVFKGSSATPFFGGHYHGKIKFPASYPFAPPSIMMITPSGRFVPNTRICMSMSDFHPESWSPMWSVQMILNALLSFMNSDEVSITSCSHLFVCPNAHAYIVSLFDWMIIK